MNGWEYVGSLCTVFATFVYYNFKMRSLSSCKIFSWLKLYKSIYSLIQQILLIASSASTTLSDGNSPVNKAVSILMGLPF